MPDVTGECGCGDGKAKDTPELAGAPEWKCALTLKGGHGPDIRKSWPSCAAWTKRREDETDG